MPEDRWRFDLLGAWVATAACLATVAAGSGPPLWGGVVAFLLGAGLEVPRLREPPAATKDDGFRPLAAMGASFAVLFLARAFAVDPLPVGQPWACLAAVPVLGSAMFLRHRARADLRGAFRYALDAGADRPLVRTGLYGSVRHPAYLGAHLFLAAVPLAAGSALGVLASLLALPLTLRRIRSEEALLESVHGDEFRHWTKEVPALWPRRGRKRAGDPGPPSGRIPAG